MSLIHVIPVGGTEPEHKRTDACFCQPLLDQGLAIHHAQDLREVRERFEKNKTDEQWIVVGEEIK